MSRSNTTLILWRKTFDACQYLPDCPPGISEPSLIDFLLEEKCQVRFLYCAYLDLDTMAMQICGLHDVSTYHVAYALNIRACAICLDKRFVPVIPSPIGLLLTLL